MISAVARWMVSVGIFVALASVAAAEPTSGPLVMERDGVRVSFAPSSGMSIDVDGVPFSSFSSLYAVKPTWSYRFYGYEDDAGLLERMCASCSASSPTTPSLSFVLKSKRQEFEGQQQVELLSNRTVRLRVEAKLTTQAQAVYEHRIGSIFPGWLAGRRYDVTEAGGRIQQRLAPSTGRLGTLEEATLARDFRCLKMDTRLGPVEVLTTGSANLRLLDYRKNSWGNANDFFLLGVIGAELKPQVPLRYEVELRFPPRARVQSVPNAQVLGRPQSQGEVLRREPARDLILPTPKKLAWKSGSLPLSAGTPIVTTGGMTSAEREALKELAGELAAEAKHSYNLRLVSKASLTSPAAETAIILRLTIPTTSSQASLSPATAEAYHIRVDHQALLEAQTTQGLQAGFQTLCQLFRQEGGTTALRRCEISDYPSLPVRAIHFFSGKNGRDVQIRMLREVLAPLKINTLVYQCEAIKWDTHPEIFSTTQGMEKADARAVVQEARRQHMNIIPLINTFGHCEWLLDNQHYSELADDPTAPYAYDPSNPKVYAICEDIYREAVAFFRPSIVHIGHDEINAPGFPKREANRKAGTSRLLLDDIEHYRRFLATLGVRTMVWGDMFLGPKEAPDAASADTVEEARKRREELSPDVLIADWHYDPAAVEQFKSLGILNAAGFDTLAATWFAPTNILHYAKAAALASKATLTSAPALAQSITTSPATAARQGRTLGLLQTTWAGYSFNARSLQENTNQYAAYVLAAEAAWTGGTSEPQQLPFDYNEEFLRRWQDDKLPRASAAGWTCDLSPVANFALAAKAGWLGYQTGENGMASLKAGVQWLERFRVAVAGTPQAATAVLLSGKFNPPGSWPKRLEIPIETTATAVVFALGATFQGAKSPAIARTTITYDDASTSTIAWRLGETVFALDDTTVAPHAPRIWQAKSPSGMPQAVHAYVWQNPRRAKRIRRISFESAELGSSLVIFGITGVQAP